MSETKGTRIDACMRSATRRRGIEIFRTVPRIVPLKFPKHPSRRVRLPRPPALHLARTGGPDARWFCIYGASQATAWPVPPYKSDIFFSTLPPRRGSVSTLDAVETRRDAALKQRPVEAERQRQI